MMKEIHGFIFLEGVKEVLKEAGEELGLNRMEGEKNEPIFERDIEELIKGFEVGKDYEFQCTVPLEKSLGEKKEEAEDGESIDVSSGQSQVEEKSAANT